MINKYLTYIVITLITTCISFSQRDATLKGVVTDEENTPLFSASVSVKGSSVGTVTTDQGDFILKVPAETQLIISVSHIGYETVEDTIWLRSEQIFEMNKKLKPEIREIEDVIVKGIHERENTLVRIDIKSIDQLPNASGNIESILKTLPGVVSGNELSSQYSVRGGSFDENLIYVNDIEIYRPLLVQSAQQEGLSFVNPSMVSSIQFSAGGFDAEYGDKLSSVLDIRYKQPDEIEGSVTGSFLGGAAHLAGSSKNNKFTFNTGFRYKTTRYLLTTLDTKADYKPVFTDFQTYLTYDLTKTVEVSFLGNYALNGFRRVPKDRNTDFGTVQEGYNLTVYYEGQEIDKFDNYLGALAVNYHPNDNLSLKLIGSSYKSNEEITYDILKQYWINLAVNGSTGRADSLINIGIGSTLEHARNFLESTIYSVEHKGSYYGSGGISKWGVKVQQEIIDDKLNEWILMDSAGMSLPYSDEEVLLYETFRSSTDLNSTRVSGFIQHTFQFDNNWSNISLTLGIRSQYWTLNGDITVSPRTNLTITPFNTPNIKWHLAGGFYQQPPFYKELRDRNGDIYSNTKAQKALHLVAGMDYTFMAWGRPFIFSSELYYKYIYKLIPYKIDDVRLQYLPTRRAKGYAAGIDFKIYGEFVPGTESWFSLSFLSTKEDIYNDYIIDPDGRVQYPGYYSRPTDQLMSFSLFFQDYLPSNPNYKVHLMVIYGTGLTYSGPSYDRPSEVFGLGSYRRVDIGFSRLIVRNTKGNFGVKSIWISAEILNLLNANNVVSYDWIRTVEGTYGINAYFAVPNYLTGRSLNFKLSAYF
ncbi:MAG: carboxypeptidase-like regulatory domain-containing protein [Bacteroidales bacterium]|nr:carboxypeptidase-like regulatory domain-containing protein [Bacteroidales bacterium]